MKANISFFCLLLLLLGGCQQHTAPAHPAKEGLTKVSIMYPDGSDKSFDMDYYAQKHMPMLAELFGSAMKTYEIDQGVSGRTPEDSLPYVAIGYLYFETVSDYQAAFGPHAEQILGDIPNYTNIQPIVQISRVIK